MIYLWFEVEDASIRTVNEYEIFSARQNAVDVVISVRMQTTRSSAGTHPQFRFHQPMTKRTDETRRQLSQHNTTTVLNTVLHYIQSEGGRY